MQLLENSQKPEPMKIYPVVVEIPVEWGDQDAYQHVNNTVSLRWFETARLTYFHHSKLRDLEEEELRPILAHVTLDYRHQLTFPDTILSGCRIARVGGKSLTMEHAIYSLTHQQVVSDGTCITVMFDYNTNESVMVDDRARQLIETMEGRVE